YRCLYSRNVSNLFMAGRDISVTHDALGPVRVMRTCGMMGEVVGMAASLCKRFEVSPRGVYEYHLDDLKALMQRGAGLDGTDAKAPKQVRDIKEATSATAATGPKEVKEAKDSHSQSDFPSAQSSP